MRVLDEALQAPASLEFEVAAGPDGKPVPWCHYEIH